MARLFRRLSLARGTGLSSQHIATIVVTLFSLAEGRAQIDTPGSRPFTLAESYERANGIIIAQVLGCANDAVPVNGSCPGNRHYFETTEVLKEAEPRRDFSGAYPRTRPTGFQIGCLSGDRLDTVAIPCFDTRFALGTSHLLFFNETGEIDWTSSGNLNAVDDVRPEVPSQSQVLQAYVTILRDFRDGRISDLSEPWIFTDDGTNCRLQQNIRNQQIWFSMAYDDSRFINQFRLAGVSDGRQRWVSRTPELIPSGEMILELITPEVRFGVLGFFAEFDRNLETEANTARISIGEQDWPLRTSNFTVSMRGNEDPFVSVAQDLVHGDAAHEIFDVMLAPASITLTKRAAPSPIRSNDPLIETRSTQFAMPAESFMACVDRSER